MGIERFAGMALVGVPALAMAGTLASGGYLSKEAELDAIVKRGEQPSPELLKAVREEQDAMAAAAMMGFKG